MKLFLNTTRLEEIYLHWDYYVTTDLFADFFVRLACVCPCSRLSGLCPCACRMSLYPWHNLQITTFHLDFGLNLNQVVYHKSLISP